MYKYELKKDGDKFCATMPGFINLQENYAGFGETEASAKIDLLEKLYLAARSASVSMNTGNSSSCGDCFSNDRLIDDRIKKFPALIAT